MWKVSNVLWDSSPLKRIAKTEKRLLADAKSDGVIFASIILKNTYLTS